MPGELKSSARCPKCKTPIIALIDTTYPGGFVERILIHTKPGNARRKYRCRIRYDDFKTAQRERRKLETRPKVSTKRSMP
jgi:hypothetical protein